MTPLEILAAKLIDPEVTEVQRQLAIEEIGQEILNYCHISAVPPQLYFTQANMAADLLRYEQAVNQPPDDSGTGGGTATGKVSSITEGDTSISFGNKSVAEIDRERLMGSHRDMLNALILNYREQLNRFRKVRH